MQNDLQHLDFSKLKRINVIGTTGSGKSVVSKQLANILNLKYIQIDQIFWGPNWRKPTNREFYDNLKAALDATPNFVLDGNYTKATDLKWGYIDTVIWLNFSITRTFLQLCKRTFLRVITRQELWPNTGNRESIYGHLFTKDSIFYWFFKTFHGNQIKFKSDMTAPRWRHLQFIELNSNADVKQLIQILQRNFGSSNIT